MEFQEYVRYVADKSKFPTLTRTVPPWKYWVDKMHEETGEAVEIANHCVEKNREPTDAERARLGEEFSDALFCLVRAALENGIDPVLLPELNKTKLDKRILEGRYNA